MPVSPVTNDFMRALPPALRPNPYSIDEHVMKAVENGWSPQALADASYRNDRNPNPAFVVTNVRHLCDHPPVATKAPTGWAYGHIDCTDQSHPDGCEICRCTPGHLVHHQKTPMPDWFRAEWRKHFAGWGQVDA
jgi:hypothetical protein